LANGRRHHNCTNDIGAPGHAEQPARSALFVTPSEVWEMKVTIDKKAWERGVRDGFARFRDPSAYSAMTNAAYSYWSGSASTISPEP
jgi:hypothetical protein